MTIKRVLSSIVVFTRKAINPCSKIAGYNSVPAVIDIFCKILALKDFGLCGFRYILKLHLTITRSFSTDESYTYNFQMKATLPP